MKNNIFIILLLLSIAFFGCEPPRDELKNDFVKLNASLSDSAETIRLGDTLKIKLTLPDNLITSKRTVSVNSLQEGWYAFRFSRLDTVARVGVRMSGSSIFISDGSLSYNGFAVNLSTGNKPFTATLNLIPPAKGVYTLEIVSQPGTLRINNSNPPIGLAVNFAVADKHWNMLAYYYNTYFNTDYNAFLASLRQIDSERYGFYGFRVN